MNGVNLRIVSSAYVVPPTVEPVGLVMQRESARVESALDALTPSFRERVVSGLGLEHVHVCGPSEPYDLALLAAKAALSRAGLSPRELSLIIDFSTIPNISRPYLSVAQKLAADLNIEGSLNFGFKLGGCAGMHLALKTAGALMQADERLRHALLVTADRPPAGSRSLLPISIQGDGAAVLVVSRASDRGPTLLASEVVTLGHLHDVITITHTGGQRGGLTIEVDSARIEMEIMPIYYLNFYRLVQRVLDEARLGIADIDHFIYANISQNDRNGFIRSLRIPTHKAPHTRLAEFGHTFAADPIINYTDLCQADRIRTGEILLFASAGIGFSWGVTLARV